MDRVLVTGASGFVAKHIVLRLVREGYEVRGTVRSEAKAAEISQMLAREGTDPARFEAVVADLGHDGGWDAAAAGCRFVLHTASPFPGSQPRGKFDLVPIARGGTLRVVEAAKRAGAERLVLTSSVAAVVYGHGNRGSRPYGEADVSNVESREISPYAVSKTEAETAAWDSVRGSALELATINPSLVLGPLLDPVMGTSVRIVAMMMGGRLPALPDVSFGIVDVRDVAEAHLAAMREPDAKGRRFIVSSQNRSLMAIAESLRRLHPDHARRLPRFRIPSVLVRGAALVSGQAAMLAAELGRSKALDTEPAREVLGLDFRSADDAIEATGASLVKFNLV